jgi:hypothetical protein
VQSSCPDCIFPPSESGTYFKKSTGCREDQYKPGRDGCLQSPSSVILLIWSRPYETFYRHFIDFYSGSFFLIFVFCSCFILVFSAFFYSSNLWSFFLFYFTCSEIIIDDLDGRYYLWQTGLLGKVIDTRGTKKSGYG